jgi:hypothetical protein
MSPVFFWHFTSWFCVYFLVHTHCMKLDNASPSYRYSACISLYITKQCQTSLWYSHKIRHTNGVWGTHYLGLSSALVSLAYSQSLYEKLIFIIGLGYTLTTIIKLPTRMLMFLFGFVNRDIWEIPVFIHVTSLHHLLTLLLNSKNKHCLVGCYAIIF